MQCVMLFHGFFFSPLYHSGMEHFSILIDFEMKVEQTNFRITNEMDLPWSGRPIVIVCKTVGRNTGVSLCLNRKKTISLFFFKSPNAILNPHYQFSFGPNSIEIENWLTEKKKEKKMDFENVPHCAVCEMMLLLSTSFETKISSNAFQ